MKVIKGVNSVYKVDIPATVQIAVSAPNKKAAQRYFETVLKQGRVLLLRKSTREHDTIRELKVSSNMKLGFRVKEIGLDVKPSDSRFSPFKANCYHCLQKMDQCECPITPGGPVTSGTLVGGGPL